MRAFVYPLTDGRDFLCREHVFRRHLRAGGAVEDAAIQTARGTVARNDHGPQHAGHGTAAPIQPKAVLLLLRPMAFVAMLFEQGLDVAREVHGGQRQRRREHATHANAKRRTFRRGMAGLDVLGGVAATAYQVG